jgi:PadR family transcriptional regulator, regulatory protein PadR
MNDEFFENWTTQLRKGVLELCILNAIRGTRAYGYDIVKKLGEIDGLVISEGTIYPILSRFKREGLVETSIEESTEGPARKYYRLTVTGQKLLGIMNDYWLAVRGGMDALRSEKK